MADSADFAVFLCSFSVEGEFRLALAGRLFYKCDADAEADVLELCLKGIGDPDEFFLVLPCIPGEVEAVGVHSIPSPIGRG